MRFTYQYQGQTYTLDLTVQTNGQYTASIGEHRFPLQIQTLSNGGWRILLDGKSHTIYAASQDDQRFVQLDAAAYTLTVPSTKPIRRKSVSTGDELTAQMPGQVTAVLVKAGDETTRGQTLLILEAMKMEIRVTAPADGQVQQVLVQSGDVVERGQRLVVFESAP
ncbi:MAG: biotin/lipoyl-containing protein [Chloroflexota bacterium]